jgi:predicted MarR family transcription regulator
VELRLFSAAAAYCFIKKPMLYKNNFRAGEMVQQLRELTALLKVLSSNPSNHMVSHKHL